MLLWWSLNIFLLAFCFIVVILSTQEYELWWLAYFVSCVCKRWDNHFFELYTYFYFWSCLNSELIGHLGLKLTRFIKVWFIYDYVIKNIWGLYSLFKVIFVVCFGTFVANSWLLHVFFVEQGMLVMGLKSIRTFK